MTLARPVSVAVAERIGRRLDVLAHPARIRIVDVLELHGELSVSELAKAVGVSVYDASQHLATLRGAGVVDHRRKGRLRSTASPTRRFCRSMSRSLAGCESTSATRSASSAATPTRPDKPHCDERFPPCVGC